MIKAKLMRPTRVADEPRLIGDDVKFAIENLSGFIRNVQTVEVKEIEG